jgi:hypothetical protein
MTIKKPVKNEEPKPVNDERDNIIVALKVRLANQEKKLLKWRYFGQLHGNVSPRNDLNNILAELKEMGEIK